MLYTYLDSPVGTLLLTGRDGALCSVEFARDGRPAKPGEGWTRDDDAFGEPTAQLRAYFAGTRREFELDLRPEGTPFQRRVWDELRTIPYGTTWSYGQLARSIGRPTAFRAVGAANGRNPLSIVVPCHRVIGSSGALTGFGGGLPVKRHLLGLEAGVVRPGLPLEFAADRRDAPARRL